MVYADAEAAGVWANSADDLAHCWFVLPAVHRDGAVTVSVSTGGLSPALASWLRTRVASECGDGLGIGAAARRGPGEPEAGGATQRLGGLAHTCSTDLFWN